MSEIKTLSVLHFTGERINGKPIIPDDVEDIQYCSFKKSELNEYKGGYYVGTMENPYKYFYRLISITGDVFLHPDTEYICTDAFYWFRGEMVFNNKLKGIGKHAFRNAFEFQRDAEIIIPDGCEKIGEGAFICKKNCHFTVHLPDTITYIGKGAFQSYPPEKIIASPAVLALIGKNIFVAKAIEYLKSTNRSEADDAKWLKEIEGFKTPFVNAAISAENAEALLFAVSNRLIKKSDYDKIFEIADASNNVELKAALVNTNLKPTEKEREKKAEKEFEKAMGIRGLSVSDIKKLWQYRTDDDGDVTLTKYIGDEVIPTIPRKIGKANVTRLGNEAFHAQSNITAVYVPDNILFIGDRAFAYCRILETVELPETLLAVGDDLFYCSEKLVNKPDVSSLKIDKPDADIMDRYDYCRFEEIKSEWKYHIDSTANECIIEKYVGSRHNITVPDRIFGVPVTSIASFAFSSGLTHGNCRHGSGTQQKHNRTIESITLPEGIKKIGSCAFSGSSKLKRLNIPVGCTVEEDAFLGCKSLAKDKMGLSH